MSEDIRISRGPVRGPEPHQVGPPPPPGSSYGKLAPWIITAVIVIGLATLVLFRDNFRKGSQQDKTGIDNYQAIFLTNGQVYFGKLEPQSRKEYLRLTDIFYLQVTQPPLQGSQQQGQSQPQQQPQLQLVKLGNELHGPTDEMNINREHVLFFEDLKDDGRVVQAIKEYKANPNRTSGGNNAQQQTVPGQQQTPPATPVQQQQVVPPINNNSGNGMNLNNQNNTNR